MCDYFFFLRATRVFDGIGKAGIGSAKGVIGAPALFCLSLLNFFFFFFLPCFFFKTVNHVVKVPLRTKLFGSISPTFYFIINGRLVVLTTNHIFQLLGLAVQRHLSCTKLVS